MSAPLHMIEAAIANFAEKSKPDSSSTFIVYNVVVFDRSTNAVTRFPKRYSEFYELHEKIKALDPEIAGFPFPPKRTTLANKQKTAIDRKNAFNAYLALLLQKDPLPLKVRQFLGLSPPSPTVTPTKTSEVVLASLSRMLSPSNKIKSKTMGDEAMHNAKANASRHDDETSMKIASVNGIKTTADTMTSSQGDGTVTNGNGRRENMKATKSSGRVFTGKPRRRGFWASVRIPFFLFLGAVVLIASGWLFMQYMSIDEVPQTKVGKVPLSAVDSFDALIVGEGPAAAKSSSVKGNRKSNTTNKRTKKSDKNGTKTTGKKREGNKAAGSSTTDSTLGDHNEKGDTADVTTVLEGKGLGKMQRKARGKAGTEKDNKKGSELKEDHIDAETIPMEVVDDVGVGVEVGALGDSVSSTTSRTVSTDGNENITGQELGETEATPLDTEAKSVENDHTIGVVNNDINDINDNNNDSKDHDVHHDDRDIDNDDNHHITDEPHNPDDNESNDSSKSMRQKEVIDHDHVSTNDTNRPKVEEKNVTSVFSDDMSSNDRLAKGNGFITKQLIPFIVACISTISSLFAMILSWITWLIRLSTGISNRLMVMSLIIMTGWWLLSHKINASLLAWYLRRILGADKKTGAFRLAISSLHFRFGWDRNDIVVDDFIWYNPPHFKSTPHFVRIGTITLRYNLQSVMMALFRRKIHPIVVHSVELEDVEMFMEKIEKTRDRSNSQKQNGTTNILNMWAAMGARDEAEEKIMNSSIQKYIAKATKSASNKVMSYIRSSTPSPTTVDGTNGGSTNFSSSAAASSSHPHAVGSSVSASLSASSTPRQSRSHSKTTSSSTSVTDSSIPSTSSSANATTTHVNVPLQSMSNDSDKNSTISQGHNNNNSILEDQTTSKGNTTNNNNNTTKTNKHFGVPYLMEVHRFVLQDLRVHAQDFLNATHSEVSDSKAIKLQVISMDQQQLNKDQGASYLDDIVWRVVSRLLNDILSTNKLSLTFNVLGAAANQTVSVVREVAASASRGVTDVILANNPKELMYMANRALHRKTVIPNRNNSKAMLINDPALIGSTGVSKVKVRIIQGKEMRQLDDVLDSSSPLVVSVRLVYDQNILGHSESIKCHPKRPDDECVVKWDETIDLPILSMDAKLHVRVFLFHLLKDTLVCEVFLPLMGTSKLSGSNDVVEMVGGGSEYAEVVQDGQGEAPVDYIPEATGPTPSEGGGSLTLPGMSMGIALHPTGTMIPPHVPREKKEVIEDVFGMNGQEVVAWYTCYGRQTDNTDRHRSKGQIELGLLLE